MTLCEHGCGTELDDRVSVERDVPYEHVARVVHTPKRCQAATLALLDEARREVQALFTQEAASTDDPSLSGQIRFIAEYLIGYRDVFNAAEKRAVEAETKWRKIEECLAKDSWSQINAKAALYDDVITKLAEAERERDELREAVIPPEEYEKQRKLLYAQAAAADARAERFLAVIEDAIAIEERCNRGDAETAYVLRAALTAEPVRPCGKYLGGNDGTCPQLTCIRELDHPGLCDNANAARPDEPSKPGGGE